MTISVLSAVLGLAGARALEIRLGEQDGTALVASVAPEIPPGAIPALSTALPPRFEAGSFLNTAWQPSDGVEPPPTQSASRRRLLASPGDPSAPLPLRLVDAGAVGIDPDPAGWQGSYSHGTGAFHALIDPRTSQVDPEAVRKIQGEWETHVERMTAFGNNAVALGAFLELISFEEAGVYDDNSPYPSRHEALREVFRDLFTTARQAGFAGYLRTDMLALTPPLERALRRRTGGILDTADPALWSLYAQGLDELFRYLPEVEGVVIRIGEAGALYNREDWPYTTRMGVQEPEELWAMLQGLLPTFERYGKTLVLRNWSVGLGGLGHLHTDPGLYQQVLERIRSPNLVVSTKFTRGDFFAFLPLNPTLASGGHRRLVEFQARREFEGFTAFPNFLGGEHGAALRALTASNPDIEGIYLWSQEGGPLHAGPRSLYPLYGFWSWIDANVHATSRLALDPSLDEATLAAMWIGETISTDARVIEGLTDVLLRSRNAVQKGLYIRPFAERDVWTVGVEVPSMMWIMEWDVVGDWRAVSSTVYQASRSQLQGTIDEGFEAADEVGAMRASLELAAAGMEGDPRLPAMRRSLEYQESLFTTLAWWRSTLLSYYGWLEQGDSALRTQYAESAEQVRSAAAHHLGEFDGDLDFPAYDFAPALKALDRHDRNLLARDGSRMLLLTWMLAGLVLMFVRRSRTLAAFALVPTSAATVWLLMVFEGKQAVFALVAMLVAFPAVLAMTWPRGEARIMDVQGAGHSHTGADVDRRVWTRAVLWPLCIAALPPLALMAIRGPDLVWFLFWSDPGTQALLLALIPATVLGMGAAALHVGEARRHLPLDALWGRLLLAVGATLVLLGLALPDLATLLSTLDDPLSFLPMRLALIVAVTAYAGIPTWITLLPGAAGVAVLVVGAVLLWRGRTRRGWIFRGPVSAARIKRDQA